MKRTKMNVAIAALCCVVVGLLLLWASTAVVMPFSVVLATLATVVITVGIVNLISDWFLQRSVTDDLISLIQTDRRLVEAGVDRLERVEDIDWIELFALDDRVECLVLDASQFKAVVWPRLLDAAKVGLKSVEVVVIDVSENETRSELARRLNLTGDECASSVARLEADIEREWKAMKSASPSKCTLTLRRSTSVPAYAYVESARVGALMLNPLSPSTGFVESRAIVFKTERRGRRYATWLTDSTAAVRKSFTSPAYSDVVMAEPNGELL